MSRAETRATSDEAISHQIAYERIRSVVETGGFVRKETIPGDGGLAV
ncbi:hypothetical protein HY468_02145 [Candidatus Roizmanbacteria bacterium]|nr:hypothetical protein [Candidatus Roizmanbacteria bacterium]